MWVNQVTRLCWGQRKLCLWTDLLRSCGCEARGSACDSSSDPAAQGWCPLQTQTVIFIASFWTSPSHVWKVLLKKADVLDMSRHILTERWGGVGPGAAGGETPAYCLRDICGAGGPRAHLGKPHRTSVGAPHCARPRKHKHTSQKTLSMYVNYPKCKLNALSFQSHEENALSQSTMN